MKFIIVFLFLFFLGFSCNQSDSSLEFNKHNFIEEQQIEEGIPEEGAENLIQGYSFYEGYIRTNDHVSLYYHYWYKKNSEGLIVLTHKEGSTLDEWSVLMDVFKEQNFSVLSYDLRGHGDSSTMTGDFLVTRLYEDLDLMSTYAQGDSFESFNKIVFIGHGIGANITLQASKNLCDMPASFILLSPSIQNEQIPLETFSEFCPERKYLFLYSQKSFVNANPDMYIYNSDPIHTKIDFITDAVGIDLLLHNSLFLKEVKKIINF